MQEATFLILTALADGSQHGYGIIAEVQEISGGRVWRCCSSSARRPGRTTSRNLPSSSLRRRGSQARAGQRQRPDHSDLKYGSEIFILVSGGGSGCW